MDSEDCKKDSTNSTSSTVIENKEHSGEQEVDTSSTNIISENTEVESRRSSTSLDDDEEGKRLKRRKDKDDHSSRNKDDYLRKEDHSNRTKDDSSHKKDDASKKDDFSNKGKSTFGNGASPKSNTHNVSLGPTIAVNITSPPATTTATTVTATASTTTPTEMSENDDAFKSIGSPGPGPKVPPLKIVIPSGESEQGNRNGKTATRHHGGLPYVVVSNDETNTGSSSITTSPSSPTINANSANKEEESSSATNVNLSNEEQRIQQRVLRSTHSNRAAANSNNNNSGNNSANNNSGSSNSNSNGTNNPSGSNNNNNNNTVNSNTNNNVATNANNSSSNINNNNSNNNISATNNSDNNDSAVSGNPANGNNSSNSGNSTTCGTTNLNSSNNQNSGNASGGGSSSNSSNSSPTAMEMSPSNDAANCTTTKEENNASKPKVENNSKNKIETNTAASKSKNETKLKSELEDDNGKSSGTSETRSANDTHKDTAPVVELHPRKRKLKSKPEINHISNETDPVAFGTTPHPHEVPVTNCYQMFMDIRKQIDVKRKGLFPIQPKPPQGFKDYLMNRCTYTLAGNSIPRLKRRNAEPPEGINEKMKDLYQEQEAERYSLRMQHVVEKEKLVLSVEQEILRVHGRAARALANQALPFSACTILKDEEVYNVITPEQEEKDRNARSRYNGRLFISWLQDVDDKWEKIKEEMLARHHKEAESLNAVQKFSWDLKTRQLGLWKQKKIMSIDESHVPMISVSDDFDLLPE